jgi:hypothetical protein
MFEIVTFLQVKAVFVPNKLRKFDYATERV